MRQLILAVLLIIFALPGWAQELILVRVHRDYERAYMAMVGMASRDAFHSSEQIDDRLLALWNRKSEPDRVDYFRQPWKEFPIAELEAIRGPVMRHALLMRAVEATGHGKARCRVEPGPDNTVTVIENCSEPIARFDFASREVANGLLIEWGCEGRILPAVDVGEPPPGPKLAEEWELFGFSSPTPIPLPKYEPVTNHGLPEEITRRFALNFDTWRLDFGDGVERWVIYYSDFSAGPYLWMITYPRDPARRVVTEAMQLYGRC